MIRFQVLGRVAAHNEGGPVLLGSARQRAVLAVLLVEPGAIVTIDQLVDRVWGSTPPQRARQTLQTYLSRLRSVLSDAGGPVPAHRSGSYVLEADLSAVDLHQFRALVARARRAADDDRAAVLWQQAMALWRGRPFADLDSEWLRMVAIGLDAERLAAIRDRTDVLLRRGEHPRLLPELTTAAGAYPLDERLAGQLMIALYRCGRQADALAHYRLLHARLVEEVGSDPGPALRELHQQILRHDLDLAPTTAGEASDRRVPGKPPAGTAAEPPHPPAAEAATPRPPAGTTTPLRPAQLPADVAGFTGRAADLRSLDDLLRDTVGDGAVGDDTGGDRAAGAVVITAIGGTAGVGKTALAVHWAHRVASQFPDGQLYVNLRGFDPGATPMPPAVAISGFLDALGVPPRHSPASLDAQVGRYRSMLAGRRMLILLDNARDAAQVRPLLPGAPGCLVVVTSRNRLSSLVAAEGARPLTLELLPLAEARQLLARRLGADRVAAEPAATEEIIVRCARLPLALAITAARAAVQPHFPLHEFVKELAEAGEGLDLWSDPDAAADLRAVFSCSYRALGSAAARLFRLLALHPGPDLATPAAASLAGTSRSQARRQLAELLQAHLITECAPGRYSFHDLLRSFATEQVDTVDSEADRRAAAVRMLDSYLHTAHHAARLLNPHRPPISCAPLRPGTVAEELDDRASALAWLTREHPVLVAAIRHAETIGSDRHAWQLAWCLADYHQHLGRWHDWEDTQAIAVAAARRLGDLVAQAVAHRSLGGALAFQRRYDEAYIHLEHSLDLFGRLGDAAGLARAHVSMASMLGQQGRHQDALTHAEDGLALHRRLADQAGQARALNGIGWLHAQLGQHHEALEHCRQALALQQEIGDRGGEAGTWDSLGFSHYQLGQYDQAARCYLRSLELVRAGNRYREAGVLTQLGDTRLAAGEPGAARAAWEAALKILQELDDPGAGQVRGKLHQLAAR